MCQGEWVIGGREWVWSKGMQLFLLSRAWVPAGIYRKLWSCFCLSLFRAGERLKRYGLHFQQWISSNLPNFREMRGEASSPLGYSGRAPNWYQACLPIHLIESLISNTGRKITLFYESCRLFLHFSSSILDVSQWNVIQLNNIIQWGKSNLFCLAGLSFTSTVSCSEGFKGHFKHSVQVLLMSIILNRCLKNKLSISLCSF